ncbi:N-acetylneuraminate synthase family protein [Vibrio chagasii]|uniref:N-acetylneuraminate synthase family protein n=1 Tax=Vibrio chagasii TaxID=170679 RepID=UPI003DA96426
MSSNDCFSHEFKIGNVSIEKEGKPYFIADVGANHDGSLSKALELIQLAADAGADAVKFQHFNAKTIVSKTGFDSLGDKQSHQSNWKKSVFEVYQDASISLEWTEAIVEKCKEVNVAFFTSPYSFDLVDYVDEFVPAYKVGSGDITWPQIIDKMASKNKPLLLACGASTLDEVEKAVTVAQKHTDQLVIMQCNTNYTASLDNFKYINLNVIKTLRSMYPNAILGLSDHTPGHATVLGAIALGANVIEKHFTDDNHRDGPDHKFAMNPKSWREMVDRANELYLSLGSGVKKVEKNEEETVVVQRRSIRTTREIKVGEVLTEEMLECLRPCPIDAIEPYHLEGLLGKQVVENIDSGECVRWHQVK